MSFDSFGDFIAMGGHAPYVWPAYAVTFAVLLGNVLLPLARLRRRLDDAAAHADADDDGGER